MTMIIIIVVDEREEQEEQEDDEVFAGFQVFPVVVGVSS
jgi:hypothetical protein